MLVLLLALPLLLPALHGGHFLPPAPDPGSPPEVAGILGQPGLGPTMPFDPERWEWWFDFDQEALLELRARLPGRAAAAGATFVPVTADDRGSLVIPLLVDCLRDKPASGLVQLRANPRDVRAAAVVALGRLQRADTVRFIEEVLENDPDRFVRTQAVLALGFSGNPQAVETLVRVFRDEGQGVELRTFAAAGLALVGDPQAVDVLRAALSEKALDDVNNQMRSAVLFAGGVCGDAALLAGLQALPATYLVRRDPAVRAMTGWSLGRLGDAAALTGLLELLEDADNQVRRSAAAGLEALGARPDQAQAAGLVGLVADERDSAARRILLRALGRARTDAGRAFLRGHVVEGPFDDRPHAAMGLALDGDAGNAVALLAALDDEHEASHVGAFAVALGLLGAPEARAPLAQRLLDEKDPLLLSNLALAVGLAQPDGAELPARLDALARDATDVEVVRSAVIGLGLLGRREQLAALARDLPAMRRLMTRAALAHSLGLVGDRSLIEPLAALARDPAQHAYVRAYALQALGELCDPRDISPCWRLSAHVEGHLDTGFVSELYFAL